VDHFKEVGSINVNGKKEERGQGDAGHEADYDDRDSSTEEESADEYEEANGYGD